MGGALRRGVGRVGAVQFVCAALLLGCAALLLGLGAPAALAAESDGTLSGTVTSAASSAGLGGIEVLVFEASGEKLVGRAVTKGTGEYTVEGLPAGDYKVEFAPGFEGGNYIAQYYEDAATFADAKLVPVQSGFPTNGVDAKLLAGAEITGTVIEATASEDIVPLKNIQVAVYEAGGRGDPVGFAETDAQGRYTVEGLPGGAYKVEFSGGYEEVAGGALEFEEELFLGNAQDFVAQFYSDKPSLVTANTVEVAQGQTQADVDAEMQRGGEIEGIVTSASTHAAVPGTLVAATGPEGVTSYATTDSAGHYTLVGLPSGAYRVEFSAGKYITQYYAGQPAPADADSVVVTQPLTTTGIDASLVLKAPTNTAAPAVSGTPAVGQTLSCSPGAWTGSPVPALHYTWLRDDIAIPGATASTYAVQSADEGNGLTCKVTATNKNGSAAAISNTVIVPVPSPPPAPNPEVEVVSSKIQVLRGLAHISIACAKAACAGSVELTYTAPAPRRHHHGAKPTTLPLGRASYKLDPGDRTTVLVRLSAAGRRLLAHARHHRLPATLLVTVGASTIRLSVALDLSSASHGQRHRGRRR
ncbi:MAG TPA: carboxypeptidase regulatory-like domain-containing protein [Solirubrobacteraceae bacterium]|nr:carboxypeptidase regulatory-like domain-containing protein [Solirubrobacteraceae bacterium]